MGVSAFPDRFHGLLSTKSLRALALRHISFKSELTTEMTRDTPQWA